MTRNPYIFGALLLLSGIFSSSCSQHKSAFTGSSDVVQIAQHQANTPAVNASLETVVLPEIEDNNSLEVVENSGIESTVNKKQTVAGKLRNTKTGKVMAKAAVMLVDNKMGFEQHKATMGTTKDTPAALRSVGLIFIVFGLIALIPPLAFSVGTYMFIIAGMLIALGAIFLLTGTARGAEK